MKGRVQDVLLKILLKVVSFFKKNKKGELLLKVPNQVNKQKRNRCFLTYFFFFAKFIRNKKPVADHMWLYLIFLEPKYSYNLQ